GGMTSSAVSDFRRGAEAEADRFNRECLLALGDDLIALEMAEPPTDAAVRTTLRVLERKGRLRHDYDGPRFVYTPTVAREAARRSAFRHLLDTFFGGSAGGAMAALVEMEDSGLSPRERQRLRQLIDEAERRGR
ncbi:MAG TPA: BlaI/MecI/CopY family transcriptional regulator, partial [Vicinamibacteria bacterium]|nr:BlaI/MecI/CopY family transcriptional regulator [Vicinamibacteria bacterium]